MIEAVDKEMGVNGTCETLGDKQVWTWEKESGGALEIGEQKRGRGRDTGDIGIGCGEGLKRLSSMTRVLALREQRD